MTSQSARDVSAAYHAKRAVHAKRMVLIGTIQIVLVVVLVALKIYNACCR